MDRIGLKLTFESPIRFSVSVVLPRADTFEQKETKLEN